VEDIPEKLITQSMINKQQEQRRQQGEDGPEGLGAFELFS